MKTTLLALTLLAVVGFGLATPAAATCMYHEILYVDPVKQDTGTAVDDVVISVGWVECHPPPPMDDTP